ncbi:hypothetical protein NDU88_005424 [Pleurodeles waltl]|uniref:Uncharacterized protein n=1 Tax=Pleurodeles waltl TaxID=8319 RepID=A0AAV7PMM1_PLEWA|nr:hypothetical protein NDU88_005424 [Pleurodeles waltl]
MRPTAGRRNDSLAAADHQSSRPTQGPISNLKVEPSPPVSSAGRGQPGSTLIAAVPSLWRQSPGPFVITIAIRNNQEPRFGDLSCQ